MSIAALINALCPVTLREFYLLETVIKCVTDDDERAGIYHNLTDDYVRKKFQYLNSSYMPMTELHGHFLTKSKIIAL